jgi:MarR family transcriptional regulator, lower aerobic nicotinate degradation pathway regulator
LRWPTYALGQLHGVARSRIEAMLGEEGLSLRAHFVLVCLSEYGELSQQQVADRIAMDRSDLVKLIDHLEALDQVVRGRDTVDRRRHILSLTAKGRRALGRGEEIADRVTNDVLAGLSAEERSTLHRLTLKALGEPTDIADEATVTEAVSRA